jgi:hypothetical protein
MTEMSRKQFLRWEKLRLKGERYYLLRSTIVFGVVFFVALNAANWAWSGTALAKEFILLYPILGLVLGMIGWYVNEDRFAAFQENKRANAYSRPKRSRK